ncbi:hypothetical protein, partial [Citrobacter werkmanii]|uniref:hypothetical protein n=1 Tax=Citrobacter werkmanii TaxID=67827 RepID=UPI0036F29023
GPKTSIIRTPTTSLKTSIKTITNLSDTNCLEIQGASLDFKVNIYDLSYIYSKGNGEENATTCSAFQNPVG